MGYEKNYIADIDVDEKTGQCAIKCAIYATPEKIGCVSDWSEEYQRINANKEWIKVTAQGL